MPFFQFSQNNTGGSFSSDPRVDVYVIVEGSTAAEAMLRGRQHGLYFDGVAVGIDCECCGDRWHSVSDEDGYSTPSHYGDAFHVVPEVTVVYFADGRVARAGEPIFETETEASVPITAWERLLVEDT